MTQIDSAARRNGARRVRVVRLKLGPLACIEPDHLRAHFNEAAQGTAAEESRLEIEITEELHDLSLESIDIESPDSELSAS